MVARLTDLHDAKVRLADEVLVVDVDGLGEATRREAELARSLGKPVRRWSPPTTPGPPPIDPTVALRESHRAQRLVEEQAAELRAAVEADDLVGVADAIADLLHVVHGAALTFGIPVDEVFAEVHRSDMTELDDGRPILRAHGSAPPTPPDEEWR